MSEHDTPRPDEPLTLKEIDDFLVFMDKKKCPWCDGASWGVHLDTGDGTLLTGYSPGLRAIPRIRIRAKEDGSSGLRGDVAVGPDASLITAVAECRECGHLSFFNYFTIMKLARQKEGEQNG